MGWTGQSGFAGIGDETEQPLSGARCCHMPSSTVAGMPALPSVPVVKFRYACIIAKNIFFLSLHPHWCISATTSRRYNHEAALGSTQPTGQTQILFSSPQLLSVIAYGAIIRPDHPTDNSPDRHHIRASRP
jgi:hypothetical protein